jgi:malonyl-CoA/methylmalonyl-CoA synthetase
MGRTHPPWACHLPPGVAADGLDLVAEGSLPAAWARGWAANPSQPTVFDGRWLRADELDARSRAVAGRLARAGLVPGDRVLTSAATSADLVVAHVGALRAGMVVVPMNTAYREREVAHIVRDARPALALVDDPARASWIQNAAGDADASVRVVGPDVGLPDGDAPVLDAAATGDGALLGYTSGTTGAPKGALLSHGNLLASARALTLAWRWTADDRLVLALPLFHGHGLCVGLHGTLLAGASAVLQPRFDVDKVADAIGEHASTLFFGVPTMYARFAASPRVVDLGRLRLAVSGSAPLAAALHEAIAEASGVRVLERYGLTETLMNTSNPYDGERRPGAVGPPLPCVDVRLAPENDEILVQGPNVFAGYWERPEANRDAFTAEGWFRTGDVGAWDDDGYLRIVGRCKELIISGGFNVYPREVEDVLLGFPGVTEVAVVGTPSDEWGETVTAVVVADAPCDEAALIAFAAERLAPYKRPRIVRFVDQLPRNALGKVLRGELVEPR